MHKQFEREEQQLEDNLAAGLISHAEFSREMRALQRDYAEAAREAASDAYDREMGNW